MAIFQFFLLAEKFVEVNFFHAHQKNFFWPQLLKISSKSKKLSLIKILWRFRKKVKIYTTLLSKKLVVSIFVTNRFCRHEKVYYWICKKFLALKTRKAGNWPQTFLYGFDCNINVLFSIVSIHLVGHPCLVLDNSGQHQQALPRGSFSSCKYDPFFWGKPTFMIKKTVVSFVGHCGRIVIWVDSAVFSVTDCWIQWFFSDDSSVCSCCDRGRHLGRSGPVSGHGSVVTGQARFDGHFGRMGRYQSRVLGHISFRIGQGATRAPALSDPVADLRAIRPHLAPDGGGRRRHHRYPCNHETHHVPHRVLRIGGRWTRTQKAKELHWKQRENPGDYRLQTLNLRRHGVQYRLFGAVSVSGHWLWAINILHWSLRHLTVRQMPAKVYLWRIENQFETKTSPEGLFLFKKVWIFAKNR